MFERFTDRARKAMQFANQEAQRFSHDRIGTEHILLGLVKEGSGVAAIALENLDFNMRMIRLATEKMIQAGPPEMVTTGKLPQTPQAEKVIEYATVEALQSQRNYVGTEDLLVGLLREAEGVGGGVLASLGLTLEKFREALRAIPGRRQSEKVEEAPSIEPKRVNQKAVLLQQIQHGMKDLLRLMLEYDAL